MLKLLFIEDEREVIEPAQRLTKNEIENVLQKVSDFEGAEEKLSSFRPDIVILDLFVGNVFSEGEREGWNTLDIIWKKHFCPIVVYSGLPDIPEKYERHPFVKSIKKGSGSEQKVLDTIREFLPHVYALKEAERDIRRPFSDAMRYVAPYAFEAFSDDTQRVDTIKRSGRRRLAALMDEPPANETTLASWEQYLFPPVSEDIRLGDILGKDGASADDPASFRVVLTPSCDLAASGNREPKVRDVLVSKCCSMKNGLEATSLKGMVNPRLKERRLKDRLRSSMLTQGYLGAVIPFPSLKDQIPIMAANLRDLALIPVEDIGMSDKPFLRIASLDSPFRELIAWAYMQTAGRPGLPDRDCDSWRDEIIDKLRSGAGAEEA